jgi:hypothetical protein
VTTGNVTTSNVTTSNVTIGVVITSDVTTGGARAWQVYLSRCALTDAGGAGVRCVGEARCGSRPAPSLFYARSTTPPPSY